MTGKEAMVVLRRVKFERIRTVPDLEGQALDLAIKALAEMAAWRARLSSYGKKGGAATKAKYGPKHWRRIAKLGGRPVSDRKCSVCQGRITHDNRSGICRKCQRQGKTQSAQDNAA